MLRVKGTSWAQVRSKPWNLLMIIDIADLNSGSENAANSNKIIVGIQERKRLTFAAEKCRILKINSFDFSNTVCVKGEDLKVVTQFKYLGDVLNSRGDNSEMIKDRVGKDVGTTNEIISLCKEVNFGKNQIANMLLLYRLIFIPRFIYNCETWTNITLKDYASLRKSQLSFLTISYLGRGANSAPPPQVFLPPS